MALNLVYPSPASWREIDGDLVARDRASRLGLQLFPVVQENTYQIRWAQRDNAFGLMAMRGIDGSPPKVQRLGLSTFVYEPGVYGEHIAITEREIMTRADPMRPMSPIPVTDLVNEADRQLIQRLDDRMEANVWSLLSTAVLNIPLPGPNGTVVYKDSYSFQTYTAIVPWATSATATPIIDLQAIQQKHLGHGVNFGAGSMMISNQFTANLLINNTNASDFGGRRNQFGATLNNLVAFNDYFGGQNLPELRVYDEGYQPNPVAGLQANTAAQFIKFIPDHVVIIIGKRPGNEPIGQWVQTMQVMQPGANPAPGEYRFVKNYATGENAPVEVPPKLEVHRGFNGGLVLFWPSAIVIATV